jgi:hypothetical protein
MKAWDFGGIEFCQLVMQTFNLPCSFPTDPAHVFLFTEVSNAIELRSKLLDGDPEYLYTFLDASLVALTP